MSTMALLPVLPRYPVPKMNGELPTATATHFPSGDQAGDAGIAGVWSRTVSLPGATDARFRMGSTLV